MQIEHIGNATLYCCDCAEVLSERQSREFKFGAIVTDPPYGIKEAAGKNKSRTNLAVAKDYGDDSWDNDPPPRRTIELMLNTSKHQIIFGGNYFSLPPTSCWLIWDKMNGANDFADCELAWTNLPMAVRRFRFMWNGMLRQNGELRGDHPTQKPVAVMQWCMKWLPDTVMSICDPFMGSGTTGVACRPGRARFFGIEREQKYFDIACRRIEAAWSQGDILETLSQ